MTVGIFDLVVVGAGPGGVTAAKAAALRGMSVALVDDNDLMGYGLRGAYKSKALWEMAREQHIMQRRWNLGPEQVDASLADLCLRNRASSSELRTVHHAQLRKLGVEHIEGRGRFISSEELDVGGRTLRGKRFVIATGTRPRLLPGITVDHRHVMTSDEIVYCDHNPKSLIVLGAGVIGCEFASIFAALGVDVSLLDTKDRVLSHEDADISEVVARSFEHLGVRVWPSVRCVSTSVSDGQVQVTLKDGRELSAEMLLLAVGRVPNTAGLGLDNAGVIVDGRGYIPVSEKLQSNVDHIYAVGDVGLRQNPLDLCLVHVAEAEARCAVAHMADDVSPLNTHRTPFLVFTLPMIAGAGDSERTAREEHGDVRVGKFCNVRNHRSHARGSCHGFVKLVVGPEGDDRVLGVRAVGDGVDTVVGEASLLIEHDLPYTHLLNTLHAHPSLSESLQGAARMIANHAVPYHDGEEHHLDFVEIA